MYKSRGETEAALSQRRGTLSAARDELFDLVGETNSALLSNATRTIEIAKSLPSVKARAVRINKSLRLYKEGGEIQINPDLSMQIGGLTIAEYRPGFVRPVRSRDIHSAELRISSRFVTPDDISSEYLAGEMDSFGWAASRHVGRLYHDFNLREDRLEGDASLDMYDDPSHLTADFAKVYTYRAMSSLLMRQSVQGLANISGIDARAGECLSVMDGLITAWADVSGVEQPVDANVTALLKHSLAA